MMSSLRSAFGPIAFSARQSSRCTDVSPVPIEHAASNAPSSAAAPPQSATAAFMPGIPSLGFSEMAAGVVHDALADEADRLLGAFRRVREDHERRTLRRRLPHAPQPAVAAVAQRLAGDDVHLHQRHARRREALGRGARPPPVRSSPSPRAACRRCAPRGAPPPPPSPPGRTPPPTRRAGRRPAWRRRRGPSSRRPRRRTASSGQRRWRRRARDGTRGRRRLRCRFQHRDDGGAAGGWDGAARRRRSGLETACPRTGVPALREQCSGSTPATWCCTCRRC